MKIQFNDIEKLYIDGINKGEFSPIDDNLKNGDIINVTFMITDLAKASAFITALDNTLIVSGKYKDESKLLSENSGLNLIHVDTKQKYLK